MVCVYCIQDNVFTWVSDQGTAKETAPVCEMLKSYDAYTIIRFHGPISKRRERLKSKEKTVFTFPGVLMTHLSVNFFFKECTKYCGDVYHDERRFFLFKSYWRYMSCQNFEYEHNNKKELIFFFIF